MQVSRGLKLLKSTAKEWYEDKALRLSAAIAYYSIFSIAPLLVIAISMAGLVFGADAVRGHLDDQLRAVLSPKAAEGVQSMVQSASRPSDGIIGAIAGFAVLLVGASGVFGQLKDALNTIWEVKPQPGRGGILTFIRQRLLNFGMVLVIGFLLLTSLILSTALAAFNEYLDNILKLPAVVWSAAAFLVSFAIVTSLFAFIFKVLPDAQIEWKHVWTGAAATAVLFEGGKFALSWYLGRESTASSFGAAGAVVLVLLWVYYTSCILFFGAEFTQVYAREQGKFVAPAANAVAVSAIQRAHEGLAPPSEPDNRRFIPGGSGPVLSMAAPPPRPLPDWDPQPFPLKTAVISVVAGAAAEVLDEVTKRIRKRLK
jgi:membrane protein